MHVILDVKKLFFVIIIIMEFYIVKFLYENLFE